MNTGELRERARRLTIWAEKLAVSFSPGSFLSFFHGQGMEYEESRQYVFGDDVRRIDWKLMARSQHPYVKVFREERELSFLVVLDVSRSLFYGSGARTKIDVASELAALLALIAENRGDRVGMILFSDRIHYVRSPQKGRGHVRSLVEHVLENRSAGSTTSISTGIEEALKVLKKPSFVLVISDYFDSNYEIKLQNLASRHDVVAARIHDEPLSSDFHRIGLSALNIETSSIGRLENSFDSKNDIQNWKTKMRKIGVRPFVLDTKLSTALALQHFMGQSRRKSWLD